MLKSKILLVNKFEDDDTHKILDIAMNFLKQYFDYSESRSEHILKSFFKEYGDIYDEDLIHHESSFKMAAIMHYKCTLKDHSGSVKDWLMESGYNSPPKEAMEYFRENYFDDPSSIREIPHWLKSSRE
ncbi:MAG: hypothetical protein R8G66_13445 [Cytophagales bacterium]|nr:hypothetical protein [Cytophagales bacterium]